MEDRIRQLENDVQKEKKVAQDFADSFEEVWRNHEDAIKSLEVSRSENRALKERIQEIDAENKSAVQCRNLRECPTPLRDGM
ncbi:hypothetical protein V6N12_017192 [Hibiscus sabdariffa]|uniref:Uncharacterized protein n=1 Tax=Hibiscus sabdariffa TaxID=183260 RepID=A0ABR2AID9_9ROSI